MSEGKMYQFKKVHCKEVHGTFIENKHLLP